MYLLTIIWTLICAAIIVGYPIYLLNKSSVFMQGAKEGSTFLASNTVELISFDLSNQSPGWSFCLDVPEITEEVLNDNPILFYLEFEDSCLKLPFNNGTIGYTANVYKNVGKVYITFKSLIDGVSNFYVPSLHLGKLKILIVKPSAERILRGQEVRSIKSVIYKELRKSNININNYEEVLDYFSNIAEIDYKGRSKFYKSNIQSNSLSKLSRRPEITGLSSVS